MSAPIKVKRLNSKDEGFKETLLSSLSLPMADDAAIDAAVAKILLAVKEKGDEAVLGFTKQFDRLNANHVSELEISRKDLEQAYKSLPAEQKNALENVYYTHLCIICKVLCNWAHIILHRNVFCQEYIAHIQEIGVIRPLFSCLKLIYFIYILGNTGQK
jgi:histidinol dehydrogenase